MLDFTVKQTHTYDVLIIGAGVAGLSAALRIAPQRTVAVVTKVYAMRSHSIGAQGGIAAALGNCERDFIDWHIQDTITGSAGLADHDAVEILCSSAPETVYALEHAGVPFSRTESGTIMQRTFGGHTNNLSKQPIMRACFAQDRTGHALLTTLWEQCIKKKICFFHEFHLLNLMIDGSGCSGAVAWDIRSGGMHLFRSNATLLAGGGYARIFKTSTNSFTNTGDIHALLLENNIPLQDMEFVQFHPTGLFPSGILLTEGSRSEGGFLLNNNGERFMKTYSPGLLELAPRDIVTRAEQNEMDNGRGINGDPYIHLDLRHLGKEIMEERLPQTRELAMKFGNIDPIETCIPVTPSAHYSMGGIPVSLDGEVLSDGKSSPVYGLFAAGECACVSVHGANRLGCNSLLEASVFGMRAGNVINAFLLKSKDPPHTHNETVEKTVHTLNVITSRKGNEFPGAVKRMLWEVLMNRCGVFRDASNLVKAQEELERINDRITQCGLMDHTPSYNTNLLDILELDSMVAVAQVVVFGAYNRRESRGGHFRKDYPQQNDRDFRKHSLIWKKEKNYFIDYKDVE